MTTRDEIAEEVWRSKVLKRAGGKRSAHVHTKVAELAKELSLEMYESVMANNEIRAEWLRKHPGLSELGLQASFVRKYWHSHIEAARTTLAAMLARPEYSSLHEGIHEALVLDNTLLRGRADAIGDHTHGK